MTLAFYSMFHKPYPYPSIQMAYFPKSFISKWILAFPNYDLSEEKLDLRFCVPFVNFLNRIHYRNFIQLSRPN